MSRLASPAVHESQSPVRIKRIYALDPLAPAAAKARQNDAQSLVGARGQTIGIPRLAKRSQSAAAAAPLDHSACRAVVEVRSEGDARM